MIDHETKYDLDTYSSAHGVKKGSPKGHWAQDGQDGIQHG